MAIDRLAMSPLHLVVWAGIEELLKGSQLAGMIALGRAIAHSLPGDGIDEKLAQFEGGASNREVMSHPPSAGRFVRLREDVFTADCCGLPWSKQTALLLERYNHEVHRGGAAVHPLHIVMHEVHRGIGNIVDLVARDPISGYLSFSTYGLQRTGLDEDEARQLLGEGSILYCILD